MTVIEVSAPAVSTPIPDAGIPPTGGGGKVTIGGSVMPLPALVMVGEVVIAPPRMAVQVEPPAEAVTVGTDV
jgi:hypothetical protein